MPSDKKSAIRALRKALSALAKARAQDNAVVRVEHFCLIAMGEWADGEREPEFLDRQLEGPWKEHYDQCAKCRENVEFFRAEARRRGDTT